MTVEWRTTSFLSGRKMNSVARVTTKTFIEAKDCGIVLPHRQMLVWVVRRTKHCAAVGP